MSKRLKDFFERVKHNKVKRRLKAAFRRKPRPGLVVVADDVVPETDHQHDLAKAGEEALAAQRRIMARSGPGVANENAIALRCLEDELAPTKTPNK